ncbi:MAG: sugar phosphate isomerase/epimerase family protein [Candidatus Latescibacterota bacterium]|nr:sugar phosphate isomerase/epimerase family protein [Candidatus Latescibacterota bacterium]
MIELATMTSVCPDWTLSEVIEGMKRHGYCGLEPRVEWGHASGIERGLSASHRAEVRRQLEGEKIDLCCIATGARMATPDVEERAQHIEDLRHYIDLAADLNCTRIRVFGGQRARDRELALVVGYVADGFRQIIDQAAAAGVALLLETHDDWSCSAPVRAVVEQVDHPNLRVLWDFMHPQRMLETPDEAFSNLGSLTDHTHAHDGNYVEGRMQVGALGDGVIDHASPLRLLSDAGWSGYFSVEVIHKPGSGHDADTVLAQYASGFRDLLPNR